MRALILFILGALVFAGGFFWAAEAGHSVMALPAAIVLAIGTALFFSGWAVMLDIHSPTSKKLGK
ncbi:hypothetical protein [Corynebacterium halotolerans]|nr:hypothetical protein [Corynebacterium halotolerans]